METTLKVIPTNSPSRKVQPKKSLAVLSSIENKGDAKLTSNFTNKLQNIRPHTNENISKRYCISQDIKDNFYAIRHSPVEDSENMEPLKAKKLNNRGRKRLSPDNNKTTEFTSLTSNSHQQLKKPRQQSKSKKECTSLYQTCHQLWPESNTLGDLSHDNIKLISDLLKIRLNQAKFKMMAKLDKDNELFSFLAEEYVPPAPRKPFTLKLNKQRNRSTMIVVGNNKNLFARQKSKPQRRHSVCMSSIMEAMFDSPTSPNDDKTSPHRNNKTPQDRKKKTPKTNVLKTKRVTTPKRRSAAADAVPVVLSDGSSVYVCEPCNKKYKNRNGLAYHMERCKNSAKTKETNNDEKPSSQSNSEEKPSSQPTNEPVISSQPYDEITQEDLFSMLTSTVDDEPSDQTQNDTFETVNDSSQLHIWDDFNVNSTFDNTNTTEQWNLIEEEDPFSSYDQDMQTNSSWNMSDLNMFNQPPSLLFTETTMDSALDEDTMPLIGDLATSMSISEPTPTCEATPVGTPVNTNTPHNSEGIWLQFANFDNDYQCETDNPL